MYHSWWFITLLGLFGINIIVCSLERLPIAIKHLKISIKPLDTDKKAFPIKKELNLEVSIDSLIEPLVQGLNSLGFKPKNNIVKENIYQFYAEKGNWSRLGVYITHLSILIIMVGAIIGIFGFKGFVILPEGESSDVVYSKDGMPHKLGFSIRCDDFDIEFYHGRDIPKSYRSLITFIKNGKEVKKEILQVNKPLKYGGYTFYQSSYGMLPHVKGTFILKIKTSKKTEIITKELGESFNVYDTGIVGTIKDFSPAVAFDKNGKVYTYTDMMNNPGVYIEFTKNGKIIYSAWILRRYPTTWYLPIGIIVEFVDYWGVQYTGLQVKKDPGVWIVYIGCIIMVLGLYITFFITHKKVWVFVKKNGKHTTITVCATANKNIQSFEKKIEDFLFNLRRK